MSLTTFVGLLIGCGTVAWFLPKAESYFFERKIERMKRTGIWS